MARFVQPVPEPTDPYLADPVLPGWVHAALTGPAREDAQRRLAALGAAVAGPLRAAHLDAEEHPPVLRRYDAWGERVDRILTAPGWETLRRAAAEHALVALPYDPEARRRYGAAARTVQHALLHLYGPESASFSCPVAMADGAAALLSLPEVDPAVRDRWLPRLLSIDPETAVTSGQWMTEASGGSDLSGTGTVAQPDRDGGWRLTGEKWFCSAADSAIAIALARPHGAGTASRALAPFLVRRYADDSERPAAGVTVHRLKQKLGTRALPTAEIGLRDAYGLPVGDPASGGLSRMMTLVVVTRLHNAAAAAAGMRRGLQLSYGYARMRRVAGGALWHSPLHRATLAGLEVDARAAYELAAHAFALLGRVEVDGDQEAAAELRLVAPLAKLATGKLAVAAASELVECFGGAGYVEDTGIPRLLRDAQVLPIWEGTTNVLALDVLRALHAGAEPISAVRARIEAAAGSAHGVVGAALTRTDRELVEPLAAAVKNPTDDQVVAGARELALRLAYALAGALLAEQHPPAAAQLWTARRLNGAPAAVAGYLDFDELTG